MRSVLAQPSTLPGFWVFMYRVSPFTYLVSAMLSTAIANTNVVCAANELRYFKPPPGQTCTQYMAPYMRLAGGYLTPGSAESTTSCGFCSLDSTNTFLSLVSSSYSTRWRDFGLVWVYIVFNVFLALLSYWLFRVPKNLSWRKKKVE